MYNSLISLFTPLAGAVRRTPPDATNAAGGLFLIVSFITNRTNFYIDGLNIYRRIRDYDEKTSNNYRWLIYRGLCEN